MVSTKPVVARQLTAILSHAAFDVGSSSSITAGAERADGEPWDLIVYENNPASALAEAGYVRGRRGNGWPTAVMVVSGNPSVYAMDHSLRAQADDFLLLPVSRCDFVGRARWLIADFGPRFAGRGYRSPSVLRPPA